MLRDIITALSAIDLPRVILPIGLFLGPILLGILAEKVGLYYLEKWAKKTDWEGDDEIIKSLHGMPVLWGILIGISAVFQTTSIHEKYMKGINAGLVVIAIFSVTVLVERIVSTFISHLGKNTARVLPGISIFNNVIKLSIYLMGLLVALHYLGISIAPLITALGIGGLAVALALQDTLSNLFSGIQIMLSKQINVGDYIRLGSGEEGFVTDITWRNTTITAMQNNVIIVPNATLAKLNFTNFGLPEAELSFSVPVGVSYDSDLAHVERVTLEVIQELQRRIPEQVPEIEPVMRFSAFSDSAITINAVLHTREYRFQFAIRSEFIKLLHKRYREEGIEIPYPIRTVQMKPTLPTTTA